MKITPLNIALACVLTWITSELGDAGYEFTWWMIILLVVLMIIVDIIFRMLFKDNQKLWIGEIGFIILTCILLLIIKIV